MTGSWQILLSVDSENFQIEKNAREVFGSDLLCCILYYFQGFKTENMKPWKMHWDRQLYKAMEHQYQLGLVALNQNLPEIKIELIFK